MFWSARSPNEMMRPCQTSECLAVMHQLEPVRLSASSAPLMLANPVPPRTAENSIVNQRLPLTLILTVVLALLSLIMRNHPHLRWR